MNLTTKLITIHLIFFTIFGFNCTHSKNNSPKAALIKSLSAPKKISRILISKKPLSQVEIQNDTLYPVYLISKTVAGYSEIITIEPNEKFPKNTETDSKIMAEWRLISFDQTKQVFLLCPIHHGPDKEWHTKKVFVSELFE